MITKKDLVCVDRSYFDIVQQSAYVLVLRSRCTGHFWALHVEEFPHFRHFRMEHKHKQSDQYHRHRDYGTVAKAVIDIKQHDIFQMNGRKYNYGGRHEKREL